MTNAERLLLLRRVKSELERVVEELTVPSVPCGNCGASVCHDPEARQLGDDLQAVAGRLRHWIDRVASQPPTSQRVTPLA